MQFSKKFYLLGVQSECATPHETKRILLQVARLSESEFVTAAPTLENVFSHCCWGNKTSLNKRAMTIIRKSKEDIGV